MKNDKGDGQINVRVVDDNGLLLPPILPARARKLVKSNEAFFISNHPPAIRLAHRAELLKRWRRIDMKIQSFTDYFKEEKDIFVQNISGGVISLLFGAGHDQEYFSLKPTIDPVVLTNHIPFDKIKKSTDFRKMVTAEEPRMRVLTQEEYDKYYDTKQNVVGKKADQLKREAEVERSKFQSRTEKISDKAPDPIHTVVSDGQHLGERKIVSPLEIAPEGEIVNPRILGICQKVSKQIPQAEWPAAGALLQELKIVAETNELTIDDYEHIRARVGYKTVKKWAQQQQANLVDEDEPEATSPPDSDGVGASV